MFLSARKNYGLNAALALAFLLVGKALAVAVIPSAADGAVYAVSVELTNRSVTAGGYDAALTRDGTEIAYATVGFDQDGRCYSRLRMYDIQTRIHDEVFAITNDFLATLEDPMFSADGSKLLFTIRTISNAPPWRTWVHNLLTGQTEPAVLNHTNGAPNQYTSHQLISGDGSTIVFFSAATDLLAEPLLPFSTRVYARDLVQGVNILVGASPSNTNIPNRRIYAADVSSDGRYILFHSEADNLVPDDLNDSSDLFIFDLVTRTNRMIAEAWDRDAAVFTKDGSTVIFESGDVFAYDMASGVTRRLSPPNDLLPHHSKLHGVSDDGHYLLLARTVYTEESDFYGLLWLDTQAGTNIVLTAELSQRPLGGDGWEPKLSGDGRYVFFSSEETNVVEGEFLAGEHNYYRWDSVTGRTRLITPNKFLTGGTTGIKYFQGSSTDGSTAVFQSSSADLVYGDQYPETDVFVWRSGPPPPSLSISISNGIARVSWPSTPYESVLEERAGSGPWSAVTVPIQEQDGRKFINLPASNSEPHFFRLRPPE